MYRRPWPILILAIIHLLIPMFYLASSYQVSGISLSLFFHPQFLFENWILLVNYTVPFWIAAFAIWKCHKWSYFLFIFCMVWISAIALFNAYHLDEVTYSNALFSMAINVFIITYFLKPSIRTVYMDSKLRWWESQTRYHRKLKIVINKELDGELFNLSLGGAFIAIDLPLEVDQLVEVAFEDQNYDDEFYFKAEVVHIEEGRGYGVKFLSYDKEMNFKYKKYISSLKRNRVPRTSVDEGWAKEFVKWATGQKV